ncbi:hypothetical protein [Chitinophaga alhagiae]|uniref:hypothetical protein n=1 Tax=Chitinophaga alhagiae TaxID=2203219 RepID=UPI000E5BD259|nr:hypothetical protein [Chitinophaga alhagiae]
MKTYDNNGLRSYWRLLGRTTAFGNGSWFSRVLRWFQTGIKLVGLILEDAGIELLFLLAFWFIVTKMGQGRDLVVSLFEPDSIYGLDRIGFTVLSAISFSVSMWIIPAFLLEQRDRVNKGHRFYVSIFKRHLFFVHRILPLIPFWLLAYVLFNGKYMWLLFTGLSLLQLGMLFLYNERVKPAAGKWYTMAVAVLLLAAVSWFAVIYKRQYNEAKVMLVIIFYLLAFLMHNIYRYVDGRLIEENMKTENDVIRPYRRYWINSTVYTVILVAHVVAVIMLFNASGRFDLAPESTLLYLFSLYIFIIDLVVYFVNVSSQRKFIATCLVVLLVIVIAISRSVNLNLRHYAMDAIEDTSILTGADRLRFEDRFRQLKQEIEANTSGQPYPIVLVAGEGGGSRAGMWFSENLINFDYYTRGNFRKHIFSISTVSGSSVGVSTTYAFWEQPQPGDSVDPKWLELPARVYNNNFVGSSISGVLLTDLWKLLNPFTYSRRDRNTALQEEEAYHTQRACLAIMEGRPVNNHENIPLAQQTLRRDFMSFFYTKENGKLALRKDRPLAFLNTCRSNDGRRGIFSPVQLGNDYFNDAVDITGYLYEDAVCDCDGKMLCGTYKKNISLGQACNTSELFPIFSAPAYIDSLGSFVDGGYHENTGLKTTLDVYQKLKDMLGKDSVHGAYRIYIVYLKNGSGEKHLYKSLSSEVPLVLPLKALSAQPFQGSASYFEERARFVDRRDPLVSYIEVGLNNRLVVDENTSAYADPDSMRLEKEILRDLRSYSDDDRKDTVLNFPLARWLSNAVIRRMRMNASLYDHPNTGLTALLETVNKVAHVNTPSLEPFRRLKPAAGRQMAGRELIAR